MKAKEGVEYESTDKLRKIIQTLKGLAANRGLSLEDFLTQEIEAGCTIRVPFIDDEDHQDLLEHPISNIELMESAKRTVNSEFLTSTTLSNSSTIFPSTLKGL